jgi:hypothetical protein
MSPSTALAERASAFTYLLRFVIPPPLAEGGGTTDSETSAEDVSAASFSTQIDRFRFIEKKE